jgi:hypothetical protein
VQFDHRHHGVWRNVEGGLCGVLIAWVDVGLDGLVYPHVRGRVGIVSPALVVDEFLIGGEERLRSVTDETVRFGSV